jgi:hypothetical protein
LNHEPHWRPWGNGLWQWFNWRWPIWRHQFTTRTIWRPGHVPFRDKAWQPDVSGWTLRRFQYDLNNWAGHRGVDLTQFAIDMNTGNVTLVQPIDTWTVPPVTPTFAPPALGGTYR